MAQKPHPNFASGFYCEGCRHSHFANPRDDIMGMCLESAPVPLVIGMAAASAIQKPDAQNVVPVTRGFFAPVGRRDTCSKFSPEVTQ